MKCQWCVQVDRGSMTASLHQVFSHLLIIGNCSLVQHATQASSNAVVDDVMHQSIRHESNLAPVIFSLAFYVRLGLEKNDSHLIDSVVY